MHLDKLKKWKDISKNGTQTSLKRIQVLHNVRYLKLDTYV